MRSCRHIHARAGQRPDLRSSFYTAALAQDFLAGEIHSAESIIRAFVINVLWLLSLRPRFISEGFTHLRQRMDI